VRCAAALVLLLPQAEHRQAPGALPALPERLQVLLGRLAIRRDRMPVSGIRKRHHGRDALAIEQRAIVQLAEAPKHPRAGLTRPLGDLPGRKRLRRRPAVLGDVGSSHLYLQLTGSFLAFPGALSPGQVAGLNGHRAGGDHDPEPRAFLASPRRQWCELAGSERYQVRLRELRRPDVPDRRRIIRYRFKIIAARCGICNKPSLRVHRAAPGDTEGEPAVRGIRGKGEAGGALLASGPARREEKRRGLEMCRPGHDALRDDRRPPTLRHVTDVFSL
jgi:hypothetical protein